MNVGIYARVSTKDKEQNPENQLMKLREYCRARKWDYEEFVDHASGAKADRPGLRSIMSNLDHLDGILVLRLDRFGRSLRGLLENLNTIRARGKFFEAIDQGLKISEKRDPMNDFMLAILGAAAEFERELISERVRDGLARAKKEGTKLGKRIQKKTRDQYLNVLRLKEQGLSIREISQRTNLGRGTVYNIISGKTKRPA